MLVPNPDRKASTYRYGFNGMEKDDELKGEGNSYDFGARMLDPRIGRFFARDPLEEKYPNVSPYCYVFNNPINTIDPDGRDAIRVIDKENKTITVKAVFYVQTSDRTWTDMNGKKRSVKGYTSKDIVKLQKKSNEYLNSLKSNIVSEGNYKGYKVVFEIEFKDGGTVDDAKEKASTEMLNNYPIGNSIDKADTNTSGGFSRYFAKKIIDNGDGTESSSVVGGFTALDKNITMNAAEDTFMNKIHEIFHTLKFDHPVNAGSKQGIMKYPPEDVSQKDINKIANDESLPSIEKTNKKE